MKNLLYTFILLFSGLIAQSQTPAITMTTATAIGSTFSFDIGANADNTAIQVDWGNGTLVNYTIGTIPSTPSGTLGDSIVKVYGVGISYLNVYSKNLTALNVSRAIMLTELDCSWNALTTLDLAQNASLTKLDCSLNNLATLDVSNNTLLISLQCGWNQLAKLDVSKNTALTYLLCSQNGLSLLDVSKNIALVYLDCACNLNLNPLDLSNNTKLIELNCAGNKITSLDISRNTLLKILNCDFNELTNLDLSKHTALLELNCSYNKITSLDVSNNTLLYCFECGNNQFTTLDVSKNTSLMKLSCWGNSLTNLDVSKNTNLFYLGCSSNQFSTLDVSKNTGLMNLHCDLNFFTFSSLPIKQPTWVYYYYSPQAPLKLPKENYILSETIDLSSQLTANGNTTSYTWKTMGGTTLASGADYSVNNGVFTFLKAQTDSIYCQMNNATFPDLTLCTTNAKITQFPSAVDETSLAVNIYPNPVSEFLNVELAENINRVEIFTIAGVKVYEVAGSNTNTARIPTADLPKGMLIVKVYGRSGVMEKKVVKE